MLPFQGTVYGDEIVATLVIKNVPDDLHARLKAQARRNHRSVTKEVVKLIEEALHGTAAPHPLARPVQLANGHRPDAEEIELAIETGRERAL
jgi:Plasmid stability protein